VVLVTLDRHIRKTGNSVTIHDVTSTVYNKRGDVSETTTDYDTVARIEILTYRDNEVVEGIYQEGDARGFFKVTDVYYLTLDNYVTHDGVKYRMSGNIVPYRDQRNRVLFYRVMLRKESE
jgi:hypothetical protein